MQYELHKLLDKKFSQKPSEIVLHNQVLKNSINKKKNSFTTYADCEYGTILQDLSTELSLQHVITVSDYTKINDSVQ